LVYGVIATRSGVSVTHLTVRCGDILMMASAFSHRRDVMDQARRLKLGAIFFAIFWIGGMLWWSGEYHPANIIILAVCGTVGGYLWYLAMRWVFGYMHLLSPNGDHGAGRKTP
jgi:hypothetical protein